MGCRFPRRARSTRRPRRASSCCCARRSPSASATPAPTATCPLRCAAPRLASPRLDRGSHLDRGRRVGRAPLLKPCWGRGLRGDCEAA
eukprot:scaffold62302_cov39-Phaeocystis_antarctica.AAC.2